MRISQYTFIIVFFFSGLIQLCAQVNRGTANWAGETTYSIDGQRDSLFVFYASNPSRQIAAATPDGDSAEISWYQYNNGTGSYDFLSTEEDTISVLALDNDADFDAPLGFQVIISGDGYTDTSRCWIMENETEVSIVNAEFNESENRKEIRFSQKRCNLVTDIVARMDSAAMNYINPLNGETISFSSSEFFLYNVNWISSPKPSESGANVFTPNDETNLSVVVNNPGWEDCWFVVTVSDPTQNIAKDSVYYESVVPFADFEIVPISLTDTLYYPAISLESRYWEIYEKNEASSAPALFLFQNNSENANFYTWVFDDSETETTEADSIVHTYRLPGNYYPYLIAENFLETGEVCADTLRAYQNGEIDEDLQVVVDEPPAGDDNMLFPNVFTPPTPPNHYWRFTGDVSLTNFEIAIYNRYGQRVHYYQGNIRGWEGWDGTINDSKRVATTGVYFYVIKEVTELPVYENPLDTPDDTGSIGDSGDTETGGNQSTEFPKELKRGFIHLYNDER